MLVKKEGMIIIPTILVEKLDYITIPYDLTSFPLIMDKLLIEKLSQFKDFIAFDYGIQINLGTIFCSSSEKEFKKFVSSAPCLHENKETLNPHNASQIYSAMKTLTDNIGKPIVIAVGKGMGGGLELRKIIGPYKFVESGIKTKSGNLCYFHQFPTEFIRKLTPEESQKVSNARKYQFSLVWNVEIVI